MNILEEDKKNIKSGWDYITEECVETIKPSIDAVAKMINGLSNSYTEKLAGQSTKRLNN